MTFNPLVMVCSPYRGDIEGNEAYARRAMRHSLEQGETPYVSHLLYTQPGVLNDGDPWERQLGMQAAVKAMHKMDVLAVYTDRGISEGMQAEIDRAVALGVYVEYRSIGW